MAGSGLNRVDIVIPGSSATAAAERDEAITNAIAAYGTGMKWDLYHYVDSGSGFWTWGYYAYGTDYNNGIVTIVTISCTGMLHPPSGSNIAAVADPGLGTTYTWSVIGYPRGIGTSGGNGGGSMPAQNSNYWVWRISATSTVAVAEFSNAIVKMSQIIGNFNYYKYVDSVSGLWIVYAVGEFFASTPSLPPTFAMVTCSGTPNPPSGSGIVAVACPAFTQTFQVIGSPLGFGPSR